MVLITAGEDQKIKFWSMQMKLLFVVDLSIVSSEQSQAGINRSACSLDIFCCHEPKNYLQGKVKGVLATQKENDNKAGRPENAPSTQPLQSRLTRQFVA